VRSATTLALAFTASDGVWQSAQPTSANLCLPRAIENDEAPVKLVTGAGGAEEALEVGEVLDGADLTHARGHVVRHGRELAVRGLVTLVRERFVGDAHLDVIRLAGEDQERRVLSLPAEFADAPVVAVPVQPPADAEVPLGSRDWR
jgi:hypothetical protein